MTKVEQNVRRCMILNESQSLWRVVSQYNSKCDLDEGFWKSKHGRRHQAKIIQAAKHVSAIVNAPLMTDSALEYFGGLEAVNRRRLQVSKAGKGKIVAFSRAS